MKKLFITISVLLALPVFISAEGAVSGTANAAPAAGATQEQSVLDIMGGLFRSQNQK